MWKIKNSFFLCKSSLSSEFYAPSFGFINAGLVTVSPLLTMPPRRKLSTFDKTRAIAWIQDGIAKAEVAQRLGVHHSVIDRLTQPFRETNSIEERPRSGRPRQTTPREDQFIKRQVLLQRDATSTSNQRQLRFATNTILSRQAIRTIFTTSASDHVVHDC